MFCSPDSVSLAIKRLEENIIGNNGNVKIRLFWNNSGSEVLSAKPLILVSIGSGETIAAKKHISVLSINKLASRNT